MVPYFGKSGKQEHFFTTRLTDSTIVDINCHMPHCQDPAKRELPN